jgi:hypothetical protein
MALRAVEFIALVLTALALVPAGAHLAELPNKIELGRDEYFVVQGIYRGWALFGFVLIPAILADLILAAMLWRRGAGFWPALAGFILMAATLAIFFTWTFPANQATSNWTIAPENWEALRAQWEYAHAANAVLTLLALCCLVVAVLREAAAPLSTSGAQ